MSFEWNHYLEEKQQQVDELCEQLSAENSKNSRQELLGVLNELHEKMIISWDRYGDMLDQGGESATCVLPKEFNKLSLQYTGYSNLRKKIETNLMKTA